MWSWMDGGGGVTTISVRFIFEGQDDNHKFLLIVLLVFMF